MRSYYRVTTVTIVTILLYYRVQKTIDVGMSPKSSNGGYTPAHE